MRILLVALNARFVHTNLALRYLRGSMRKLNIGVITGIREFSINDSLDHIAAEIYEEKPDALGFSCYIWNIALVLRLIRRLRLVLPRTLIFVGGPEVSYDAEGLLADNPEVDAVAVGEGEIVLPELIRQFQRGRGLWSAPGVVWRLKAKDLPKNRLLEEITPVHFYGKITKHSGSGHTLTDYIITNPMPECLVDLNDLPNPYGEDENFSGKLVYVETSRGCPYNCRFCISSTFRGVRYLNPESFRGILRTLFSAGARTIKFVDRTFNANKKHGFAILEIFRDEALNLLRQSNHPIPRAHCEMAGELIDQEWLEFLLRYPKDMIQLEIGVQTTHQPTLEAVNRPQNFARWRHKIEFLRMNSTIPIHLDLIAGLPYEGWDEFKKSFNDVYEVSPNHLQLGFLKVLKGSGLWEKKEEYGLINNPDPPYMILQTQHLSHDEILALIRIEEILELYVNSERFVCTWRNVFKYCQSPFDVFHALAEFWHHHKWFSREWSSKALFHNLWLFLSSQYASEKTIQMEGGRVYSETETLREALKFDYLIARQGEVPEYLKSSSCNYVSSDLTHKSKTRELIRTDPVWQRVIPELKEMDRRQWARASEIEYFEIEEAFYLFFYSDKGTEYYRI